VFAELLQARLAGICELSPLQMEQLNVHYQYLVRWNRTLNLTSLKSEGEIVERHYCESLFLAAHLPPGQLSVADVGSGAGFPGIPLAVLRPECRVALIESHQRKSVFLRESSRMLPNVRVLALRAETVTEKFDWGVSRAVAYADIYDVLCRLAGNVALLAGEVQSACMIGFEWQAPILLPWGRRRYLWTGRRIVSRET
jgi:16S rRNA (guanine527-N7)-methyltransferase